MAQFQASQPLEGLSTTRPPFFDETNYNYWKKRMKVFILANVPKAWIVTMKGPYVPMKVVGEREVPKEAIEWNDEDLRKIMINNKAINMLQCALNPMEFHRVSGCDTAKKMRDMLEVTHEGTSQVKESKINRLIYMYELFKMKSEESIQDMYTRLNDIVTNLKALGKVYPSQEVVRKVLRSLPKNWEAKKTAIKSLRISTLSSLKISFGKLMTYEIEVQVDDRVEVVEKKKKDVAFKASNQKEKSEDDASDGENISTLISREVKRFMKKNIKSKLAKRDEGESTKRSVKCYECNKMGHYKNECPKLKKGERKNKKSMKKKAFTASWSNDETSSTESESSLENGVANLCFMAQEDSYNDEESRLNHFHSRLNPKTRESSLSKVKPAPGLELALLQLFKSFGFLSPRTNQPRSVLFPHPNPRPLLSQNSPFTLPNTKIPPNLQSPSLKYSNTIKSLPIQHKTSSFSLQFVWDCCVFSLMASRRAGSKRKQVGSSSTGGQAQEEDIPEGGDDDFQDINHALVRAKIAPNCTENQIKVGSLTPENRALQWIVSRIIAQRKGSKSFVLASDLPWFDYLLKGKKVNLGRFILQSLIKNYSSDMGFSHRALITRLVKRHNIDLEPFKYGKIKDGTTITKASFEKMQVVFRNGSWRKKGDQAMEQQSDEEEGDTDQEMAEQREEEHGGDSPRPFQVSMHRTNRETMELMINEMWQLHIDFYGFWTEMRGRMDIVDGKLDQLVNHFFLPPPPSAT
ncbi:hypothetical protein SLEP1_g47236 [Rubroshorea leprosula]|uniref:CCHC-type domain-containing protein n=1 Tax=Rubroshorea leprosula TaxID=152421 RepID=A0AAV5LQM7_9ROSI|nr:hypothetical protein SLEP1_g47236 [Rubroshorea leprosula]